MRTDVAPGQDVAVYAKDKWQPAKLVEVGRKWAKVTLGGKSYITKVPATAVRPLTTVQKQHAHTKVQEPVKHEVGLHLVEEDHYLKIKNGDRLVALFIKKYAKNAHIAFEAMKNAGSEVVAELNW